MEELLELRHLLEAGKMSEAMLLLDEMDEMAKDDKINKIESYLVILMLHLIKQQAERKTTRSWNLSIRHATRKVLRSWKRRKAGGYYLNEDELREAIAEVFDEALDSAAVEAFGGSFSKKQLASMINAEQIQAETLRRLTTPIESDEDTDTELPQWLK